MSEKLRQMKSAIRFFLFALIVGSFSCSKTQSTLMSTEAASKTVEALTQAALPKNATEIRAVEKLVFTTVFDVRFTCTAEELDEFLYASPFLPDQLEKGNRSVFNSMSTESWWQPDDLQDVNGLEADWTNQATRIWCNFMTGKDTSGKLLVYASFTIE